MIKKCRGCGIELQSLDNDKIGYIPLNKYDNSNYCQRCFRLEHYGENKKVILGDLNNLITKINTKKVPVLYLVDFLNINKETMDIFLSIKNEKVLVISKSDLIPKSIKKINLINNLKNIYKVDTRIKFISSKRNEGLKTLNEYLTNSDNISYYVVGLTNSGKSSFINGLIEINNSYSSKLTTSYKENTTLDMVEIRLNDKLKVIDTPGINLKSYLSEREEINDIDGWIKPITYQMKENESLKIDNILIKFSSATSVTLYLSNKIKSLKYYRDFNESYSFNIKKRSDLVIKGLGFISIKDDTSIFIDGLDEKLIEVRESLVSYHE